MEVLRLVRSRRVAMMRRRFAALALLAVAGTGLGAQSSLAPVDLWPIKTREHVDLWLHGFAIVSRDTLVVPLYKRGYRAAMTAERQRQRIVTDLDANADLLGKAIAERPALINAQFVALDFATWTDFDAVLTTFVNSNGSARGGPRATQAALARLGQVFSTAPDRDFLRRYVAGLRMERERFHHDWWLAETRRRDAVLARVDSIWQRRALPALRPFLNRTQQATGEVILSTVLEGEGRTQSTERSKLAIAVGFPDTPERAMDAIAALLHELVGPLTTTAVEDNVTPAEKRDGVAERYQSMALVRGGAVLAARIGPDVVDHYMRFYLRAAGREVTAGDIAPPFANAFPLPETIVRSLERQVNVAYSGI
jgi:hypothetical protein